MTQEEKTAMIETLWAAFRETGNVNFYLRAKKLERALNN